MKFSEWCYTRPDYSEVKIKIDDCKNKMRKAMSYQMFRDSWLKVKKNLKYITERIHYCMCCAMSVTV